jgi:hypothetical protein
VTGQEAIVLLGRIAESQFGLTVGENPHFGGVDPVHVPDSNHYRGLAIDVTGPADRLAAFNRFLAKYFGDQLSELFYDPGVNIKHGKPTGAIGGHGTHVHVATEPGGLDIAALAGLKGGTFKGIGELPGKIVGAAGDAASSVADEVIDGIVGALGEAAAKMLLYIALVGGGAALIVYGVSKASGVSEATARLYRATPTGRVAGAVT